MPVRWYMTARLLRERYNHVGGTFTAPRFPHAVSFRQRFKGPCTIGGSSCRYPF
jgi:hypothetical protein